MMALDIRVASNFRSPASMRDGARARRSHLVRIFPQHAALIGIGRWLPGLAPFAQLGRTHLDIERALLCIDGDDVAVLDQADRPADGGFRSDVANAEAARAAGKPAVGDERNLVAGALAIESGRGGQHFAHAGAPLRALVADDKHLAILIVAPLDGCEAILFAVEAARRPAKLQF